MPAWFDPRNAGPDVSSRKGADIAGCADTLLSRLLCLPARRPDFLPAGWSDVLHGRADSLLPLRGK